MRCRDSDGPTRQPSRALLLLLALSFAILTHAALPAAPVPRLLVLSTLDGGVVGLDAATGVRVFVIPPKPSAPAVSSWAARGQPQYIPALNGALYRIHPDSDAVELVDDAFLGGSSPASPPPSEDATLTSSRSALATSTASGTQNSAAIVLKHQHTSVTYIDAATGEVLRTVDFASPAATSAFYVSEAPLLPGEQSRTRTPTASIDSNRDVILLSRTSVGVRVLDAISGVELANASLTHTTPSLLDGGVCRVAAALSGGENGADDMGGAYGGKSSFMSLIDSRNGRVTMMSESKDRVLWTAKIETDIIDAHGLGGVSVERVSSMSGIGGGLDEAENVLDEGDIGDDDVDYAGTSEFGAEGKDSATSPYGGSEEERRSRAGNDWIKAGEGTLGSSNTAASVQQQQRRDDRSKPAGVPGVRRQPGSAVIKAAMIRGRGSTRYAVLGVDSKQSSTSSVDSKDARASSSTSSLARLQGRLDERRGRLAAAAAAASSASLESDPEQRGLDAEGLADDTLNMPRSLYYNDADVGLMDDVIVLMSACVAVGMALGAAVIAIWRKIHRRRGVKETVGFATGSVSATTTASQQDSVDPTTDPEASNGSSSSVTFGVPMRSGTGWMTVGGLEVSNVVLGVGSHGTVVYEGRMMPGSRRVAVKRLLRQFYDSARKEISLLVELDEASPHVVRYFAMEEDAEFIYLALELCAGSLGDRVRAQEVPAPPLSYSGGPLPRATCRAMRQLVQGLADLHKQNIVHRDVKPQNLLITRGTSGGPDVKLADVGLALRLAADRNSYTAVSNAAGGVGTTGWRAPEVLSGRRQTKAVDIFAAGCVISFVLTGGDHPFGETVFGRDGKIADGAPDLRSLAALQVPEALDIVQQMISSNPAHRPTALETLQHPFFWTDAAKLAFLVDISDRLFDLRRESVRYTELLDESRLAVKHCSDWPSRMDPELMQELGRGYISSASNLLRIVRNKRNHYSELSPRMQKLLGPLPDEDDRVSGPTPISSSGGKRKDDYNKSNQERHLDKHNFLTYFLRRVPHLLMCVHSHATKYPELVHQPHFTRYGFKMAARYSPLPLHPRVARLQSTVPSASDICGNTIQMESPPSARGTRRLYHRQQLIQLSNSHCVMTPNAVEAAMEGEVHSLGAGDRWRRRLATGVYELTPDGPLDIAVIDDADQDDCAKTEFSLSPLPKTPMSPGFYGAMSRPPGIGYEMGPPPGFERPSPSLSQRPRFGSDVNGQGDIGPPGFDLLPPPQRPPPQEDGERTRVVWPSRKSGLGLSGPGEVKRDWGGLRR
jgi:serine/threonine-protein kinase/endoribonuclease IRE1